MQLKSITKKLDNYTVYPILTGGTPMKTSTKQQSNKQKSRENDLECLKFVGLFGWLTVRQIGQFVWYKSNEHTARNKAALAIKRLENEGMLKKRLNQQAINCYVLTPKGASFVNYESKRIQAKSGLELSTNMCLKQEYLVDHLIEKTKAGCVPFGPAAMRLNVAGIRDMFNGNSKMFDGAYYDPKTNLVRYVIVPYSVDFDAVEKFAEAYKSGVVDVIGSDWIIDAVMKKARTK